MMKRGHGQTNQLHDINWGGGGGGGGGRHSTGRLVHPN